MEPEIKTADVLLMAGFVAVEMANQVGHKQAVDWLAHVADYPQKWHREARAFLVLTDGEGSAGAYKYEAAARAIVAALGVERA